MDETHAVTIRLARPDDLAVLDALFGRSYPALLKNDYPPSVRVTAIPLISRAQPALLASGTYWVAEREDGQVVGAGGWTRAERSGAVGDVRHVVTEARCVRQGICGRLMRHAIAAARTAGLIRLDCLSTRTAVPFYASLGFAAGETVDVALARGVVFPAVRMRLGL
ncbi:GNAT family N-acetyltransferase [Tranquillimonas rosea]|uniref:GNAT family N-acetyltransferase n=1 Tax=Tranquillimonas rosea TaxID=641238 RepID=UPI003BAB8BBC